MRVKLKDICTKITDGSHFSPIDTKNGYPILSIQDMLTNGFDYSKCKHISKSDYDSLVKNGCKPEKSDVLIAKDGSYLKEIFVVKEDKEEVVLSSIAILKPNTQIVNPYFLKYYLSTESIKNEVARKYVSGSVLKRIILKNFANIEIDLPDRKTQDKIAEILSGIDEQINRNNEVVKKLQVLGNTIYSDIFKDCKTTCSLMSFPYIHLIKQGIDVFKGKKHYIATADVVDDNLNFDASKITFDNREGRANMQPIKNSVWFAQMKNSVKHIFVSNNDNYLTDNYIFSTGFYGFRCDDIAYEFMVETISLPYFEKVKDKMANGAIMASINSDSLHLIEIPSPTIKQLTAYHERVKDIYVQISAIKTENHKLSKLKEKLLPLLINGQLSI